MNYNLSEISQDDVVGGGHLIGYGFRAKSLCSIQVHVYRAAETTTDYLLLLQAGHCSYFSYNRDKIGQYAVSLTAHWATHTSIRDRGISKLLLVTVPDFEILKRVIRQAIPNIHMMWHGEELTPEVKVYLGIMPQ